MEGCVNKECVCQSDLEPALPATTDKLREHFGKYGVITEVVSDLGLKKRTGIAVFSGTLTPTRSDTPIPRRL